MVREAGNISFHCPWCNHVYWSDLERGCCADCMKRLNTAGWDYTRMEVHVPVGVLTMLKFQAERINALEKEIEKLQNGKVDREQ